MNWPTRVGATCWGKGRPIPGLSLGPQCSQMGSPGQGQQLSGPHGQAISCPSSAFHEGKKKDKKSTKCRSPTHGHILQGMNGHHGPSSAPCATRCPKAPDGDISTLTHLSPKPPGPTHTRPAHRPSAQHAFPFPSPLPACTFPGRAHFPH